MYMEFYCFALYKLTVEIYLLYMKYELLKIYETQILHLLYIIFVTPTFWSRHTSFCWC